MNVILYLFLAVSALGLLLSLIVHAISLFGQKLPFDNWAWKLHTAIFIVWIPAVLILYSRPEIHNDELSFDEFMAVVAGCPQWMIYAMYALLGYAILNAVLTYLFKGADRSESTENQNQGSRLFSGVWVAENESQSLRLFSGIWIVFYYIAVAVFYSLIQSRSI